METSGIVILIPVRSGAYLWLPLTLYSAPLIIAKYLFQLPAIVKRETPLTDWVTFVNEHDQIFEMLWGNILIVILATINRVTTLNHQKKQKIMLKQAEIELRLQQRIKQQQAEAKEYAMEEKSTIEEV